MANALRSLWPTEATECCHPAFTASVKSVRAAWSAGATPNRIPVTSATPAVNAKTRQSIPTVASRGVSAGSIAFSHDMAPAANSSPLDPPATPSRTLSVRSCRQTRQRPAPSAARIAISFCRTAERASNRLATFAQAINRTRPTAPSRTNSFVLTSLTRLSRS